MQTWSCFSQASHPAVAPHSIQVNCRHQVWTQCVSLFPFLAFLLIERKNYWLVYLLWTKPLLILVLYQSIMHFLGIQFYNKHRWYNYSFSTIYINLYIFVPYYIRISKTILNANGDSSHPRLIPDLNWNDLNVLPLKTLATDFFFVNSLYFWNSHIFLLNLKFNICWSLRTVFGSILIIFFFVIEMNYTDRFPDTEYLSVPGKSLPSHSILFIDTMLDYSIFIITWYWSVVFVLYTFLKSYFAISVRLSFFLARNSVVIPGLTAFFIIVMIKKIIFGIKIFISIVAVQYYISYRYTIQWFTIFKSYTPFIVFRKYWLYSVVQYILIAYFIPKVCTY